MSSYSFKHNYQNSQSCDCNSTSTTTIPCGQIAEKPCITLCDDVYASDCIIYDGDDNLCYGIKNGDTIKKVFEIIFNKLQGVDCDCNFGNAVITFITDAPNTLCINIMTNSNNICQNVVNQSITSGIIINGKQSYQFAYQGDNYIIKWSDTANRWEIYKETNMIVYLAYLNSNAASPIGPLSANQIGSSLSWIANTSLNNQAYITTRETCPQKICVSINGVNIQFNSYYDTVYNNIYKHAYVSCTGNYTIKWNAFMLMYELFDGVTKIATTVVGDLETTGYINWLSVGEISPIKSKKGTCAVNPPPSTTTTTTISCESPIEYIFNTLYDQMPYIAHYLVNCNGDEVILYSTQTTISVGNVMYSSIEPTPIVPAAVGVYCQNNGLFNNCISINSGGVVGSTSVFCL